MARNNHIATLSQVDEIERLVRIKVKDSREAANILSFMDERLTKEKAVQIIENLRSRIVRDD